MPLNALHICIDLRLSITEECESEREREAKKKRGRGVVRKNLEKQTGMSHKWKMFSLRHWYVRVA